MGISPDLITTLLRRHRNDGEKGESSDVFIVNCRRFIRMDPHGNEHP